MSVIRTARIDEIAALNELIAHSARELSRSFYTDEQIASLISHVFGVDTQLVVDASYFVVEDDSALVACGGWSARKTLFGGDQAKDATDARLDPAVDAARIRAFFVHPSAARRGIGKRLLTHCESEAKRAGFSRAELMATLPGVPFYTNEGYRSAEPTSIDLPDGVRVDLLRMVRELP